MPLILDQSTISLAAEHLEKGELVAFPTETVYGLGADASNEKALQKLYATKGRPGNHPVIVHLASFEQISDWCLELPDYARLLARKFWPGPMTLIVKKTKHVSPLVTGGQDTIGLRVPAHPLALMLLRTFAGGIAAPSANKYGRISSTCAEHVAQEFGDEISVIIDGGSCPVGIESTIIDVTGTWPRVLRPGSISEQNILECIGLPAIVPSNDTGYTQKQIRVPGSDKSHYAPNTPLLLLDKSALKVFLADHKVDEKSNNTLSYAVLAFTVLNELTQVSAQARTDNTLITEYIQASSEPKDYARDLYANLRKLDNSGANYILVEAIQESADWFAIADRLQRAATNTKV